MRKRYYRLSWMVGPRWQEDQLFNSLDEALNWLKGQEGVRKVQIDECDKNGEDLQ